MAEAAVNAVRARIDRAPLAFRLLPASFTLSELQSIYELLLPPAERPTQFHVGNTSFDPVHLGYSTEQVANSVLLDTTKLGNGNGGHVYGTTLTDAERYALIEFIKTL